MAVISLDSLLREKVRSVEIPEDLRASFDGPSQECLEKIEDWERQNRRNAAALLRRNPTIR